MNDWYIVEPGGRVRKAVSLLERAMWFEKADGDRLFEDGGKCVARDEIPGGYVSTVFLGLDHSRGGSLPVLFETMIFGGPHDQYQERYETVEEARAGHAAAVAMARAS